MRLPARIRACTWFLIIGLLLSGLTALPIPSELALAREMLGSDWRGGYNRWLYLFGMIASLLVPLWAAAFGQVRGIPIWWRFVDASFGVGAFVPSWLCWRWTAELEQPAASQVE